MMTRRTNTGFTLVELMMVVALISVLTTLGIATVSSSVTIEQESESVARFLREFRRQTMKRGEVTAEEWAAVGEQRGRFIIEDIDGYQHISIEMLETGEDASGAPTYYWVELLTYRMREDFKVFAMQTNVFGSASTPPLLIDSVAANTLFEDGVGQCSGTICRPVALYVHNEEKTSETRVVHLMSSGQIVITNSQYTVNDAI